MRNKTKENVMGIMAIICIVLFAGIIGRVETHYTREGKIVEICGDLITVEDKNENLWTFFGEDFSVGTKVRMTMFTNYTDDTVYDDEVVSVKEIKK